MYADNTLTPRDATRLCALGTLALGPLRYSALVNAVRHFVSRVMGPSLDLMGNSIELLKYEGLVAPVDGEGMADDATLAITGDGMTELRALLRANMRSASSDLNKLVVTLKFRFLHFLDTRDQRDQADILVEVCGNELARLDDLREHHAGTAASWSNGSTTTSASWKPASPGSRTSAPGSSPGIKAVPGAR